jgi:hypothetical protein
MQHKSLTDRQRYWLEHIQSQNKPGMRMSEYARENKFPVRAMYDAKKALVSKGVLPRSRASYTARFESVQIVAPSPQSEWRITLPNRAVVEFSGTPDEQTISTVLKNTARA